MFCILSMTPEHMLHISDHCLLRQQNLISWACVRRTTSANIPETHLPRTIKSRSFQPLLHCWRVQFYREKSSRGYPLTMSLGAVQVFPAISTGSECSDLVLWACFHQPFGAGYVINERAIARKQRNRSKKRLQKRNHLSSTSAHH